MAAYTLRVNGVVRTRSMPIPCGRTWRPTNRAGGLQCPVQADVDASAETAHQARAISDRRHRRPALGAFVRCPLPARLSTPLMGRCAWLGVNAEHAKSLVIRVVSRTWVQCYYPGFAHGGLQ